MVVSDFPTNKTLFDSRSIHDLINEYGINAVYEVINDLPEWQAAELYYNWEFWARPNQLMPGWAWRIWFLMSGRGAGKTRVGAEFIRKKKDTSARLHLVGRTSADVRDVMVEGESGILSISPPWDKPKYRSTTRSVEWDNGSKALCFSADEPNLLRGPQCHAGWADEIASWRYLEETWNNFMFGLRLGDNPQAVATSTPRPVKVVKELVKKDGSTVHVTVESTYANRANLSEAWFVDIVSGYEGTRLGLQELHGKVLDDNPNALWTTELLDRTRVIKLPPLAEVVVGVDPSTAENPTEDTAECGIIVAGRTKRRSDPESEGYLLDDMTVKGGPHVWAQQVVAAFHKHKADRVVAEANNGGALVKFTIQAFDRSIPVTLVHASRGKQTRATPIATLYERSRIHHLGGFPELEVQYTDWEPGMDSPDRLDAAVWAFTDLMIEEKQKRHARSY